MAVFGPKTPVELGWLVSLAIAAGAAVWGAAVADTKLNSLIKGQDAIAVKLSSFDSGLGDVRKRIENIELYGSPTIAKRISVIEADMTEHEKVDAECRNQLLKLADMFRLHATGANPLNFPPSGGKKEGETW